MNTERLNAADIARLLAVAISRDGRELSQSDIASWTDAALRVHWTFEEANEAILEYYAETPGRVYIRSGDISAIISRKRHTALPASSRPFGELRDDPRLGTNPDEVISTEADRLAFLAEIRRAIATKGADLDTDDADAVDTRRADPTDDGDACLSDACPWCRASIGNRCTSRGRPLRFRSCHPARAEAKTERLSRA